VLDQHLTRQEEEEEVAEHKATSLDALKGLEAARKYVRVSILYREQYYCNVQQS
jgi:hypothetical protein